MQALRIMTRYSYHRIFILLVLAVLPFVSALASTESYIQILSGKIKKGDSCTVIDDKFLNLPLSDWNQVRHLSVDNIITFELRRDTVLFYQSKPFSCTINITIKYFTTRDENTPKEIDNIDLKVKYDTATGKIYPVTASYKFKNAFKVTVIVNSISSPEWGKDLPPVFRLSNQILVERKYPFDKAKAPPAMLGFSTWSEHGSDSLRNSFYASNFMAGRGPGLISFTNATLAPPPPPNANGQLSISWQAISGAEEYDVEWTYIDILNGIGQAIKNNSAWFDGTQLLNIPEGDEAAWMLHDNTRVTVKGNSYTIDLPYAEGFVLMRVRGVSYDATTNLRITTPWQYTDAGNNNYVLGSYIQAHQPALNWQYSSAFAEEGKRKEVMSYFDATLRKRQEVTIENNELDHASVRNIALVSETVYDNMGRPTMQVLPAPLTSNILQFYSAVNKNGAGEAYSRDDIGSVGTNADGSCNITAAPMSNTSGAAQYYSANNPFLPDQTNYFFAKYIPDAGGKPFSLTEYTADNTGRIRRQGGVGPTLQPGGGHDTRYYYGKPSGPRDLERLFGMEAGDFSHYAKNLMVDANGQVSVTYLNADGRTVATALEGNAPPNLDALPSATGAGAQTSFSQVLIQPADFKVDAGGLYKSSSTTFTAPFIGSYTLHFNLSPAVAVPSSPNGSATFCSNCYYDITIDVKDNCGNLVAHDYPATPPFPGSDISCHDNPQTYTGDLTIPINNIGEYTVIYTLKLSETEIKYQTDYYVTNNTNLRRVQNFFEDLLPAISLTGCYDDCSTCIAKLGSHDQFVQKMQALLAQQKAEKYPNAPESNFDPNSPYITHWIDTTYQSLYDHCVAIQSNCSSGSACEQKKQMMKNDVIPGGQYAPYDADAFAANAAQVFTERAINVALLHYPSMPEYFTDDNGNQVHAVDDNGNLASSLSEVDFIRAYQNHLEWADYFVQFHIEYCSYLWCKDGSNPTPSTNMEVSYTFDQDLRQIYTTGELAAAKGYYDHGNVLALMQHDPFFSSTGRGAGYVSQMTQDLQNYTASQNIYMKDQSGNTLAGKDIISYIDWLFYCLPGTNATTEEYLGSWQSCNPDPACRSVGREWAMYRNNYLQLKSKYIQLAKQTYDPTCRNCFVGNDGLNTGGTPTCVSMKGSSSNSAFTFDGMGSYSSNTGNPNAADLMASAWTCNAFGVPECDFRSLFKWDLSSIPTGATITGATLYLYANANSINGNPGNPDYNGGSGTANAAWLQRVTSSWAPGTTGWGNQPAVSTSDQIALPQSTYSTQDYTVDVTNFVSQWVANPASNYGMMLQLQNEVHYNSLIFGGPAAPDAIQPVLQICYSTPPFGVNAPILTSMASCNNQGSNPPPCPDYSEFHTEIRNTQETNNINGSGNGFYSKTSDVYLVHNGGPVQREVSAGIGIDIRSCYNCADQLTYPNVTFPAGVSEIKIGQDLLTYALQNYQYTSYYSYADYSYTYRVSCPPVTPPPPSSCLSDPNAALYQNKMRIFNDYVDQTCFNTAGNPYSTDNSGTGYSTASLTAMRQAMTTQLDGLKMGWLSRLQAVRDEEFPGNPALSDDVLNNLVNQLYGVAQAYVNGANESNMRVASSVDCLDPEPSGYEDFQAVFYNILGSNLISQGFSQDLLDKPYPCNKQNFDTDPVVSSTSDNNNICSNLNDFRNNWINSGSALSFGQYMAQQLGDDYNLTDAQLTDLQNKCSTSCLHGYLNDGMTIPVALASNNASQSCSMISQYAANFASDYPSVTLADKPKLYKLLFTNFMNHTFGYSLSYGDYADFQDACSSNSSALLYDKPTQLQTPPDDFLCTAGIMQSVFTQAGIAYDAYITQIRRQFRNSYVSNCLANQAGASMTSQNWEYHYTLYYYDQSGNLIKTIPPEGVQLLSDDQIDLVEQLGTQSPSSCAAFPTSVVTDKATVLNDLSASLQNNSAQSLEMWLYSTAGPTTRTLRMITPDNKYMYQAAIANQKLWVELYTLSPGAGGSGEMSITLSNQAVADLSAQLPLQSWTHLVIQSSGGLVGGTVDLYLDGKKLPLIPNASAPPYPFPWEIDAGYTLPTEDVAALKHLRVYSRTATDAEITADFKNSCLGPVGDLAGTPLTLWGRFDVPSFCNNTGTATPVTIPDRGALTITSNPNTNNAYVFNNVANNFTVEFWVNPQTPEPFYDGEATDIYAGLNGGLHNYVIFPYWGGYDGAAGMGVAVGTNGVAVFEHADAYIPATLLWQGSINGWTHVAIVYSNKTPSLYINGVYVTTGNTSVKTSVWPSYTFGGGGYGFMQGSVDEVRIWDNARTGDQIYSNYNKSISPDNMAGLLGYWPMDATSGNVIHDISCGGHDETMNTSDQSWTTNTPSITETNYVEYANRFIVPNHGMPTNYAYNSLNQVIQQISPDRGTSQFWFDRLGRMAVSQDAEQKNPLTPGDPANRYSYTLRDALGRITEVGEKINIPNGSPVMSEDLARTPSSLASWLGLGNNRQVKVTAYDTKPVWSPLNILQSNLRKRIAATALLSLVINPALPVDPSQNRQAATYFNYDANGNVSTLVQENTALISSENQLVHGTDGLTGYKTIQYDYDLISGKVNKIMYEPGKWDQFNYQYLYDAENRLIKIVTRREGADGDPTGSLWTPEASYTYYPHGSLARAELGNQVQGMDYAYTLQGWLKGVNGGILNASSDMSQDGIAPNASPFGNFGRDVMAYSLGYYQGDYTPIGLNLSQPANAFNLQYQPPTINGAASSGKDLFNGFISSSTYALSKLEGANTIGYSYRYDQLSRLVALDKHNLPSGASSWDNSSIIQDYHESIAYDGNGNIKTYLRNGNSTQGLAMDDLTYGYNLDANGHLVNNKLRSVKDAVTSSPAAYNDIKSGQVDDNYTYDGRGAMIGDQSSGGVQVKWNSYGKIESVTKPGVSTTVYGYDAAGMQISKSVTDLQTNVTTSTYYVYGGEGNVLGVYSYKFNGSSTQPSEGSWLEQYLYGGARLGVLNPNVRILAGSPLSADDYVSNSNIGPAQGLLGLRTYELTNHVGNVMATISDKKISIPSAGNGSLTDHYEADIQSMQDYYPFGMSMPGRNYSSSSTTAYRYGFNGQEHSSELNGDTYKAEFWQYDGRIARRWNMDPVFKEYESPYSAFAGNPVSNTDPDGSDTINIVRATITHKMPTMKSGLDNFAPKKIPDVISTTGAIDIVKADGPDVFRLTTIDITIDENGNQNTITTVTDLKLNDEQTFYRTGGHNVKGYHDDRYALAANAPDWLLKYYANKNSGWDKLAIQSALAYQKDVPFANWLGKIQNITYTVTGAYGIFRFGMSKLALQAATEGTLPNGRFYSVAFRMKLPSNLYPGGSYYQHFKAANEALDAAMTADRNFAAQMEELGVTIPRGARGGIIGESPTGWVWHHNTETGIMELVPKSQHPDIPGGIFWEVMHPDGKGGMSRWNK